MKALESVAIRPMVSADLERVLAIAESLPEAPRWPPSAYLRAIGSESTPRRIGLVAVESGPGSVLGFVIASLLPPQAELETIAVSRESQRQGLGRNLLSALAGKLKTAGIDELLLEVRSSNQPALAFYQSLSFVRVGLRTGYYTDPIEDAVLMSLALL